MLHDPLHLKKPILSSFRVYAVVEAGALLVRQKQCRSLAQALDVATHLAQAVVWEIREFRNGVERLVRFEE